MQSSRKGLVSLQPSATDETVLVESPLPSRNAVETTMDSLLPMKAKSPQNADVVLSDSEDTENEDTSSGRMSLVKMLELEKTEEGRKELVQWRRARILDELEAKEKTLKWNEKSLKENEARRYYLERDNETLRESIKAMTKRLKVLDEKNRWSSSEDDEAE